jgi:signal transduction histidine kinase
MSTMASGDDSFRRLRHDIKGCLNSLVLSVEVLSEKLEPDEAMDFLDGLQRAADKMATLIDQLPYEQIQAAQSQPPAQAPAPAPAPHH